MVRIAAENSEVLDTIRIPIDSKGVAKLLRRFVTTVKTYPSLGIKN